MIHIGVNLSNWAVDLRRPESPIGVVTTSSLVCMDQRQYIAKVDAALADARCKVLEFVDAAAFTIRSELAYQHAKRRPFPIGEIDPHEFVRAVISERQRRALYLPKDIFADPAWDILLELTLAHLEHRRATLKELLHVSTVSQTTTIRWVASLCQKGLVDRSTNSLDKRSYFVALSEKGWAAVSAWLDGVKM